MGKGGIGDSHAANRSVPVLEERREGVMSKETLFNLLDKLSQTILRHPA